MVALKVKCFNGQTYDVQCESSETTAQLQAKIAAASGIAPERQTLLFKGQMLDGENPLSNYGVADGEMVNVVRRIGAAKTEKKTPVVPSTTQQTSTEANGRGPASGTGLGSLPVSAAVPATPSMEDMMRSLGLGGVGPGGPGMGGMSMADLMNSMGAGASPAADPAALQNMMGSLPGMADMISGILSSPAMQDYLNDPNKQEESRNAIKNNPMLRQWLQTDPQFASLVDDPQKWKESMDAARSLLTKPGQVPSAALDREGQATFPGAIKTAAAMAPASFNVSKISEAYGHVLGQSLVNNGLGLIANDVVKGLLNACQKKEFPMPLPEYERQMGEMQKLAEQILTESNLEAADRFFLENENHPAITIVESGKVLWEKGELQAEDGAGAVEASKTLMLILQGSLLDGRVFFTCPAADESGESVHPLTLKMSAAPPALAKALMGMREGEERTIYIHPSASEGMPGMFGDILPPNALLVFNVELVSADAPAEDVEE